MIKLELKHNKFKGNEKWPLLYVIADIYFNRSSADNPLLDSDVVRVAKEEYNLTIERHLVKKYRNILTTYFGFGFSQLKKGYYLSNDFKMFKGVIKNGYYPDCITNFDEFKATDEFDNKVSIIATAIRRKRKIQIEINNYVYFNSDYLVKKKNVPPMLIKPKILTVTPLQIFIRYNKSFLLSFNNDDNHFYIHLLSSIELNKNSITRFKSIETPYFDLKKYVDAQDFIVTGPVDENYNFVINNCFDPCGEESIYIARMKNLKQPDMPSFLQSIYDLYGESIASKLHFRSKNDSHPYFDIPIEGDNRIESFLERFRQCKEIGSERWYWEEYNND